MNDTLKSLVVWVLIGLALVAVFSNFQPREMGQEQFAYSDFLKQVDQGAVTSVIINSQQQTIRGVLQNNRTFSVVMPLNDQYLLGQLMKKNVNTTIQPPQEESLLTRILISWVPTLLFIGVWIYFLKQMQGGGRGGALSFGKSRARLLEGQVKVTFVDVAGVEEAKQELVEIVDFLKDPAKFQNLGGKIPRGVLLIGPPGTGKTLLAKAIAGEASVPFFTISGSDFVEMFVGVGASRVRDMFEQAKKQSPCIIFIDEIDAVGRKRGAGLGGGHDEREQTLNQLLVEMDGFDDPKNDKNDASGVIVIAATNRPDVLDSALLRPGRFDRQVFVGLPDIQGREQILSVHMRKLPLDVNVNARILAQGTAGFSGADLANLVNEAALLAARRNKKSVSMDEFEHAKDKVMMGTERKSMVMSEKEKRLTAYHEGGHAIVGYLMKEHDPVYKISIIPRGKALGLTMFLPDEDRYSYTKQRLEDQICSLFGGRLAEIIIFGTDFVTTGASNDIQRATDIARNMVTKWGFSDRLGPLTYGEDEGEIFVGHMVAQRKEFSDETANAIDKEIRLIIDKNYQRAHEILTNHLDKLHLMAEALIKYETLDVHQIKNIMEGKTPPPPQDWVDTAETSVS